MRIGVICEGPSDFPALTYFFGDALTAAGIDSSFLALFPEMGKTRPEGGWANVLLWLNKHPPDARIQQYFGGGLFSGALSTEPLDAILIQLDGDVLDDRSFQTFVSEKYNYQVRRSKTPATKASQVEKVISLAAKFDTMTLADRARHVISPAIESTETWCVAAFYKKANSFESLTGLDLINAFMTALERSEGRIPEPQYSSIDKSLTRRRRFCELHASGSTRIRNSCLQFERVLGRLAALT